MAGPAATAIVQTGRIGDLWFTVPLADHLRARGERVEVWYDAANGNVFEYFPSVIARPVDLPALLPGAGRAARVANAGAHQLALYTRLRAAGRHVIWNQIYPFRLDAYRRNEPYPTYWYRKHPGIDFRRARTTLDVANDGTILYFAASRSLRVANDASLTGWLEGNLARLEAQTGYRTLYVPPPGAPDHPHLETWRGDLSAYQQLIARSAIVYGISTSAHVLAQLLGKRVIACYLDRNNRLDTIGAEDAALYPGDEL